MSLRRHYIRSYFYTLLAGLFVWQEKAHPSTINTIIMWFGLVAAVIELIYLTVHVYGQDVKDKIAEIDDQDNHWGGGRPL